MALTWPSADELRKIGALGEFHPDRLKKHYDVMFDHQFDAVRYATSRQRPEKQESMNVYLRSPLHDELWYAGSVGLEIAGRIRNGQRRLILLPEHDPSIYFLAGVDDALSTVPQTTIDIEVGRIAYRTPECAVIRPALFPKSLEDARQIPGFEERPLDWESDQEGIT